MKKIMLLSLVATGLLALQGAAQVDTTKPRVTTKGDEKNVSTRTSVRTNVPKAQRTATVQSKYRPTDPIGNDQPDVLLDIPNVSVDDITLRVHKLHANLSLDARVANLVQLKAGVDLNVDSVYLNIKGVQATVLLIVRLDNVRAIIDKTLETLNNNPQLVERLLSTVDNAVNTVGEVANTALKPGGVISQTVNSLGQTVQHTLDASGNILEKTLDATGKVVSTKSIARLLDLPVISETKNATGQTVKRLRESADTIIEVVLDQSGKIVSQSIVGKATGSK